MLSMNHKISNLTKCLFRSTTSNSRLLQCFPNIPHPPTLLTTRLLATQSSRGGTLELTKSKDKTSIQRQKIVLNDEDLIETFVRGSGPGGQCINKRSNCVDLRHIPTGLRVQVRDIDQIYLKHCSTTINRLI